MFDRLLRPARFESARKLRRPTGVESAIERLEDRLVLSTTTVFREFEGVDFSGDRAELADDAGSGTAVAGRDVLGEIVAAYFFWHGEDRLGDGGDGVYDTATVTFEGVAVTGVSLGIGGTADGAAGGSQAFRADVTDLVTNGWGNRYSFAGLASQPGHHATRASLLVLFRDGYGPDDRNVNILDGEPSLPTHLTDPYTGLITTFVTSEPAPAPIDPVTASDLILAGGENEPVTGRLTAWRGNGVELPEAYRCIGVCGPQGQWRHVQQDGFTGTIVETDAGTLVYEHGISTFVFTPKSGFSGTVTFYYQVCDGPVGWAPVSTARLTITIGSPDPPVEGDDPPVDPPVDRNESADPVLLTDPPVVVTSPPAPAGGAIESVLRFYVTVNDYTAPPTGVAGGTLRGVTVVVPTTDDIEAHEVALSSLALWRGGSDAGLVEGRGLTSHRYLDVDGDGREDLVAVFAVDWTDLWDGHESAVFTGALVD